MARVSIIAARSLNRVIGVNGKLPWHIPRDLARFKRLTLGKPVIMGRRTWESLPNKPLRDRPNIVLTRNSSLNILGVTTVGDLDYALENIIADEVFIIGGAEIFARALPIADKIYLTDVLAFMDGDTFFPEFSEHEWTEVLREEHDGCPSFIFRELIRETEIPTMACSIR